VLNLVLVYTALAIFTAGMLYKSSAWFRFSPGIDAAKYSTWERIISACKGIILTLLSPRIFTLFKVFILDIVFQRRIFVRSPLKWLMHMSIFASFMLLLLMHALSKYVTAELVSEYYPTINPFFFLRDFFGALVLLGVGIAIIRRLARKSFYSGVTNAMDFYALAILAVIIVSGVVLEGAKMVSRTVFTDMVDEYMMSYEPEEVEALEAYWVKDFGLVSPSIKMPPDEDTLELGMEAHEMNCAQCHAPHRWAFTGYAFAKAIGPLAAPVLDGAGTRTALFYIHLLSCLIGLAYLPFSKMFHIFTAPLSLMMNAVMEKGRSDPANMATKLMVELDACTHCGSCTRECSVETAFHGFHNINILPSERMASIRRLASGKPLGAEETAILQHGIHICTDCGRCAEACTSGIDLTNLWREVREALLRKSIPEYALLSPLSRTRAFAQEGVDAEDYSKPIEIARAAVVAGWDTEKLKDKTHAINLGNGRLSPEVKARLKHIRSAGCYRCSTCSSSCPVVRNYPDAEGALGLLPHQMMHAVGLGLWDLVLTSKMLWNCLGCYQCQENCPQCIGIADILCELKNEAIALAEAADVQSSRKDEVS
jgi:heterodisulfide reductase subunit C/nitrate reductase gamma subunit